MALVISPDLNLFNTVNAAVSTFMTHLSRVQVYLDDWDKNPDETKERIKSEFALYIAANAQFLIDVNDYVQNYPPPAVPSE